MPVGKRLILLVDDDPDDIELLDEAFSSLSHLPELLTAQSGRQALDLLLNRPTDQLPDLIILDYNMPDMTGAEVLGSLRNVDRFNHILKVVWSTSDASLYEKICKENGATHFFRKPDNIEEIHTLAMKLLAL
ncbi:MAG: response regulator [Chitinophagaceae bacterium]|nr:response regulator [Chitinophagaceae bacterium]